MNNVSLYGDVCNYLWKCSALCRSPMKYSTMEEVVDVYGQLTIESIDIMVSNLDGFTNTFEEYFFSANLFEVVEMDNGGKEIIVDITNPFDSDPLSTNLEICIRGIETGKMSMSSTCAFSDALVVWDGCGFVIPRVDRAVVRYLEKKYKHVDPLDLCQMSGIARKIARESFEKGIVELMDVSHLNALETWVKLSEICCKSGDMVIKTHFWTFNLFQKMFGRKEEEIPNEDTDEMCAICMDSISDARPGKRLHVVAKPQCGHKYHLGCIAKWLYISKTEENRECCPTCKRDVNLPGANILYNLF